MKSELFIHLNRNLTISGDKIIVIDSSRSWTWKEIIKRANDYSSVIAGSPSKNKIIPFIADRSGESIAAILGCLLSRVGFAPLSAVQPAERIKKCLDALEAKLLLHTLSETSAYLFTDINQIHPAESSSDNVSIPDEPFLDEDIIYSLFTSGSTGVPKGVLVSAGNIQNTMDWSKDYLNWFESDKIGNATNFFFDISIFDIFAMIYFNVPVVIYSNPNDTQKVVEESLRHKVTSIFSVPLFFSQISRLELARRNLPHLRRIISGGDFFPPMHILNWLKLSPHTQIYNVWGPTETSIVNTMNLIGEKDLPTLMQGKSPSVGKQHPLMEHILVSHDRKTIIEEAHIVGEVVMLGASVSQGYLNNPELSAKSFSTLFGKCCYFTEDLGFKDNHGNLFITGRLGSTVKVAGYRVDLGEIDSMAMRYNNVHLASTFLKKISDEVEELWLVIEPKDITSVIDIFQLKSFLRSSLPHYMVPKRIFFKEKLPLNINGKIDRKLVMGGTYE